ncbi:tyrosine-type recombinase/integrase [Nostocoides veronense]|uniref:Tyrosine-type recombinase/integrase n=1 Tax=Nostocoides veronense TaxID=330836 RepID=A0ABN2LDI2_9MICO
MSRPRIPVGGYGEITFFPRAKGRVEARTRFRDWDGQTRLVQATASSRPAAEVELKRRLAERNVCQPVDTTLTPDSPFPALVEYWLADLDLENRIAPATRFNYERDMERLVLPAFRGYTLREIGVARCDALLKRLGQESYSSAKRARTVLRQSFALAVRHEVLVRNPIDNVSRLHKPKRTPTALSATEVNAIRAVIKAWELSSGTSGPNPDGQLGQIVEVMLGTSARIGEVLAIRRRDLDLTTTPATLRICGTVISERGVGTYRQEHPKTDRSNRVVALPSFTAEALRRRLAIMADHSLDALVFRSREGTPLTTANVRRQLRKVLGAAGIEGVSPHMFRRTVATVINEQASLNLASELLGHTDPKVTIEHYIRRNEQVNPLTAELLDQAFAREDGGGPL